MRLGPSELEETTAKKRPKKTNNTASELFKIVKCDYLLMFVVL
jgi:hypothetical protein